MFGQNGGAGHAHYQMSMPFAAGTAHVAEFRWILAPNGWQKVDGPTNLAGKDVKKPLAKGKSGRKMTLQGTRQLPISVSAGRKGDMRTQFAALCWRVSKGKPEILLITSRGTNRWIVPKGWPMSGLTPGKGALTEAWEEAGVKGKAYEQCLGLFSYLKRVDRKTRLPCVAMVYPVKVSKLSKDFPEAGERKRKWFSPKKAAAMVREKELAQILKTFDPRYLKH